MTAKLFTIGDSVSQGFMSGAAANTHLCYSTLLAEAIGVTNYRYLNWDERYKTKIDMERIFRKLESRYGSDIKGLEWAGVIPVINSILDQAEEYFEFGDGKIGNPVKSSHTSQGFHNVSVEGMDVADAFMVTPKVCRQEIAQTNSKSLKDNWLQGASHPFYRNAYRVLNPKGKSGEPQFENYSAVDWLKHTCEAEGVENVCLFLGANNALGTVLDLNVAQSHHDGSKPVWQVERCKRSEWNLWHPNDFREEYTELLNRVVTALKNNKHNDWHVFVGTVPLVTIAPLAKGVGEKRIVSDPLDKSKKSLYFQYYTYFPLSLDSAKATNKLLKFEKALFIDETIIEFNNIIRELVDEANQKLAKPRFHIVDVCDSLTQMAWKRNMGKPTYSFPEELKFVYPRPNTKYYHANDDGEVTKGGLFSLDGVHPTATGQGLLAWDFLQKMQEVRPELKNCSLKWSDILASDTLRTQPISLMQELYQHDKLIELVAKVCKAIKCKD